LIFRIHEGNLPLANKLYKKDPEGKRIDGLTELDKVREYVGYCFRWQTMSELLAAPAIVFRGREEGYKAAVIKSRFLLYANGVAIQNPSNERCGSRGSGNYTISG